MAVEKFEAIIATQRHAVACCAPKRRLETKIGP
jgi:hypothetical protein